MGLVLIIGIYYAMALAAGLAALGLFQELRAAWQTVWFASLAFFAQLCVWFILGKEVPMLSAQTQAIIIIAVGAVTLVGLLLWKLKPKRRPATLLDALIIALASMATLAGTYVTAVAWLSQSHAA